MRHIDQIIIHCTATYPDQFVDRSVIDQWHKQRGWKGIGYHWVVNRDGSLEIGRDEAEVGAHARGFNTNSIGVVMVGGLAREGEQPCNFTDDQWIALHKLVLELKDRYPDAEVLGHNNVSEKTCPTFDVKAWWGS